MKVWITRPESGEIYMGGYRSVDAWLEKPAYSHWPAPYEFGTDIIFYDKGWTSGRMRGVRAKTWLKQDMLLFENIWKEIVLSVSPKGMFYDEGTKWFDMPIEDPLETNYSHLINDKQWETKCNTCYKRFLLEVDIRALTIERVIPTVYHREWADPGEPLYPKMETTDQISNFLALERRHLPSGYQIPF